jgi:hypothetical protein
VFEERTLDPRRKNKERPIELDGEYGSPCKNKNVGNCPRPYLFPCSPPKPQIFRTKPTIGVELDDGDDDKINYRKNECDDDNDPLPTSNYAHRWGCFKLD